MKTIEELVELYQHYSDDDIIALHAELLHSKSLEEKFQDMCSDALHNWRNSKEREELKSKRISSLQNKLAISTKHVEELTIRLKELENLCKRRKIYDRL